MRKITQLIFHCADTPTGMDVGVEEIRRWHTDLPPRGNGWSDIGYHYVIRRDGTLEDGRPDSIMGAHVYGHNSYSIGICLVGGKDGFNFTRAQMVTATTLVGNLRRLYDDPEVLGHRDFDSGKECPQFDAALLFG
jgi:N-acetylmuramoyl-L-alanine amidase